MKPSGEVNGKGEESRNCTTACKEIGMGSLLNVTLVSVIAPVYNAARWLPQTLATAQALALTSRGKFLVDGCSQDGSQGILEAVVASEPSRHAICLPSNQYSPHARNVALASARETIITVENAG